MEKPKSITKRELYRMVSDRLRDPDIKTRDFIALLKMRDKLKPARCARKSAEQRVYDMVLNLESEKRRYQ